MVGPSPFSLAPSVGSFAVQYSSARSRRANQLERNRPLACAPNNCARHQPYEFNTLLVWWPDHCAGVKFTRGG